MTRMETTGNSRRPGHRQALAIALALLTCCVVLGSGGCAVDTRERDALASASEQPLGGEALEQRKHDLDRAYRDMEHFHKTMQSLIDRHDSHSIGVFDRFVETYMGTHLEPLLESEWQSTHPGLMARDASLRFIQAEIFIQMRYPSRVQDVREEIERRYEGRDQLLIRYPVGETSTLGRGLELLSDRKWRG